MLSCAAAAAAALARAETVRAMGRLRASSSIPYQWLMRCLFVCACVVAQGDTGRGGTTRCSKRRARGERGVLVQLSNTFTPLFLPQSVHGRHCLQQPHSLCGCHTQVVSQCLCTTSQHSSALSQISMTVADPTCVGPTLRVRSWLTDVSSQHRSQESLLLSGPTSCQPRRSATMCTAGQ